MLRDLLLSRRLRTPLRPAPSMNDVYLSPHFDDIAFSLGIFAQARRAGRLLNVFTRSEYVAAPALRGASIAEVSAMRREEDRRFAEVCGLAATNLNLDEAPLRGHHAMDTAKATCELPELGARVIGALNAMAQPSPPQARPWLFCPMAIGGHVDHTAILYILAGNRTGLEARYRLAFYEDLPYAAFYPDRVEGLDRFRRLFGARGWRRRVLPLAKAESAKLALIRLYASQHETHATSLQNFSPRLRYGSAAHEALWTCEDRASG
jgi:LmbE family N-acetylglucosaminyl deacetylase